MAREGSAAGHAGGDASALQMQGRNLLMALYAAAQTLRLYPLENETVQRALGELQKAVAAVLQHEGLVVLRVAEDFLFLNDARLRMDLSSYGAFSQVRRVLSRHGVGEVDIEEGVTSGEWAAFLSLLLRSDVPAGDVAPYERFIERLQQSPVEHIRTGPEQPGREPDEDLSDSAAREAAKRTYAQSVNVARQVLTDVRLGRAVNVRRVKRAVQAIVDQVLNNEQMMFGMTTLRDFDEYTFTHCVNVCIFSIVIGQRLALTKQQLYELGIAALFHDIGKQRVGAELINKAEGLSDDEWDRMQRHTTEGLLVLFSMHGFGEVPWRPMLVAYEHHMKLDLSGYPKNTRPRSPTLFSRIVSVADGFEAGTARRSYQAEPPRAELVLSEMRDNPRRGYDPLLVKALINVTGIFPIGTLVILDTHELAVVVAPNRARHHLHQPIVKVISDSYGRPMARPATVDLSEADPNTGQPMRTIIKTTDPERYGIRVSDYFT
jgi:HD-GYP domain-containing protein (c-di-GMP phosphodiesterase class II)